MSAVKYVMHISFFFKNKTKQKTNKQPKAEPFLLKFPLQQCLTISSYETIATNLPHYVCLRKAYNSICSMWK